MALGFSPISGRTITGLPIVGAPPPPPPPPSAPPASAAQASGGGSMGGNVLRPDWSGQRYRREAPIIVAPADREAHFHSEERASPREWLLAVDEALLLGDDLIWAEEMPPS